MGLSWDNLSCQYQIDVDLQAVIVNDKGAIADAVYYDRLSAFDHAVLHGGDSLDGDKEGYDELIWVQPHRLPQNVRLIIFVVGIYNGGTLMDVDNGVVSVFDLHGVVARIPLERSFGSVDCVAVMKHCGGTWNFHKIDESAEFGQHFIDILEPTIGDVIRKHIPQAPFCKMSFNATLTKGHVVDVPLGWLDKMCYVGIGWDVMPTVRTGKGVDLDVVAVFFDSAHNEIGAVTGQRQELFGARHSGDNTDGSGTGDDESVHLDLSLVPDHVSQIFFVVSVRTPGFTLSSVQSGYCRFAGEGGELGRYDFLNGEKKPANISARLLRSSWRGDDHTIRWCFQTVGRYCHGRSWHSTVKTMQELCKTCPMELQGRAAVPVDENTGKRKSGFRAVRPRLASADSTLSRKSVPETQSLLNGNVEPFINPSYGNGSLLADTPRARFMVSL